MEDLSDLSSKVGRLSIRLAGVDSYARRVNDRVAWLIPQVHQFFCNTWNSAQLQLQVLHQLPMPPMDV